MKLGIGHRVIIAHGVGKGIAGVVVQARQQDGSMSIHPRGDTTLVYVMFDQEPGTRYEARVALLADEPIPKKPPMPSVRKSTRRRRA